MSKKREVAFLLVLSLVLILSFSLVSAVVNNTASTLLTPTSTTNFQNTSTCLQSQIDSVGYSSMTVEELAFSLLALGYDSTKQKALKDELEKRKSTTESCWSSAGCTVKETSLVMLAYMHINADVTGIKNWLMNQTMPASDLTWYLEVETNNRSQCTIVYDNSSKSIVVEEDKQITGNAGVCLRQSSNNYWLEVDSRCYDKTFEVSCDNDFLTSTFYKKKGGDTYYVTTSSQTASPNGKIITQIDSLCFKQAGYCSYEASLWGAYAINKKDSAFKNKILPYLIALSGETSNQRYFPSAFLYSITGFNEYLTILTNLQNTRGYWQIVDASKRYYDTGIALLALYGHSGSTQSDAATTYLLSPNVQSNGCWNSGNIRDTALLMYSIYPKPASSGGGVGPITQCSDYKSQGYACLTSTECDNLNGNSLSNFNCFSGLVCCDKSSTKKTCSEEGGVKCSINEECSIDLIDVSDSTSCCPSDGQCIQKETDSDTNECLDAFYTCKSSCDSSTEEISSLSCSGGEQCCSPKTTSTKSYWWLWLLIILIILIILAIVFRDQLKVWWFKVNSKFGKGPVQNQSRPYMPPHAPMMPNPGMQRRMIIPQQQAPPRPTPRPFPKEKELEQTLKKLKEMGR
jgi:hypothetical protein